MAVKQETGKSTQSLGSIWNFCWPFIILFVLSLGLRIFIFSNIRVGLHTDSVTYLILGDLETVRTPGYPFFLEILQFMNDLFGITTDYFGFIAFIQVFFLGIFNVLLIYHVANKISKNRIFSFLLGILYNLDFLVMGFEFQLLTEHISITLLLVTILLYLRIFDGRKYAPYAAGVSAVFLLLTRPTFMLLFIFFPLLTVLVHFRKVFKGDYIRRFGKAVLIFTMINIVGIGGWSVRNKITHDYFGLSSLMPYQLRHYTQHFFHKYKKDDNEKLNYIADVYLEEDRNVTRFNERLRREMGLSDAKISQLFMKLNIKVIKDNPWDYIKQIPEAVGKYYGVYSYWWTTPNHKKLLEAPALIPRVLNLFYHGFRFLFTNLYTQLFMLVLCPVGLLIFVRRDQRMLHLVLLIIGVTNYNFAISVLSCNSGALRYRVPVEPLIVLVTGLFLFFFIRRIAGIRMPRSSQ